MDIDFQNKDLRKLCESDTHAQRKLGPDCAKKLRARLSDLEAAERVTDLVAGKPHPLAGDRDGQFALSLAGGARLTIVADHEPLPTDSHGKIDWSKVSKIRIVFIGDYHD